MFLRRGGLRSAKRPIESPVGPDLPTFLGVAALPPRVRDGMSMVSLMGLIIAARLIDLWIPRFFGVSQSGLQICRTVEVRIGILQSKLGSYKKM
jgi:hypothetical protein